MGTYNKEIDMTIPFETNTIMNQIPSQLDYTLKEGMEEWADGNYKITDDFYRLIIHTDEMQKKLWRYFGKMVPLGCPIKLSKGDVEALKEKLYFSPEFYKGICGMEGRYRVKSFTLNTFYGKEDALVTEEELKYDYDWADL